MKKKYFSPVPVQGLIVQDQEMDIFGSSLVGCKKLNTLRLAVGGGGKLTERTLGCLLTGIKSLEKTLDDLFISFDSRGKFRQKATIEFLQGLIVLKKLKKFNYSDGLHARNVRGGRGLENFPDSLKEYQNLKCLKEFIFQGNRFI